MEGLLDHSLRDVLATVGGIDRCVSEFIRITLRQPPPRRRARQAFGASTAGCPQTVLIA